MPYFITYKVELLCKCGASVVQCGTVWYSVVQFGTVWYSVVQCGTVWYSLVQCGASVVQEWYLAIKIRNHQATELLSISTPY